MEHAAVEQHNKACILGDMQISYYDISRGVYDLAGRVKVTGTMGVPLCLSSAVEEKSEQENIIYGDDSGAVIMLQCGRPEMPVKVLKQGDFQYVHDDHTDWVTQVRQFSACILCFICNRMAPSAEHVQLATNARTSSSMAKHDSQHESRLSSVSSLIFAIRRALPRHSVLFCTRYKISCHSCSL